MKTIKRILLSESLKSKVFCACLLFIFIHFLSIKAAAQDISIKRVVDFGIEKIEKREVLLKIVLSFENQTKHGGRVTIKNGYFYKNGERYGSFILMNKVKIKKESNEDITIVLKVKLEKDLQLLEEGLNMLLGKSPEIMVSGVLKATNFIFSKKYPFNYKQDLSLDNWLLE